MDYMSYIKCILLLIVVVYIISKVTRVNAVLAFFIFYSTISIILLYIRSNSVLHEYKKYINYNTSLIPNIIYTYWDNRRIPSIVNNCIKSWKRHNPTYKVYLIHKDNLSKYMDVSLIPKHYSNQLKSDLIRLYILEKYGGIWIDASIYLNESLDWIHGYQIKEQSEFVGYRLGMYETISVPVVESWFLATVPSSSFIRDWKNKFFEITKYANPIEYVDYLKLTTNIQNISIPYYLSIHVACQYVLQHGTYKLSLLEAGKGPLLFRDYPLYHLFMPVMLLFKDNKSPLVKIRGGERSIMNMMDIYL